MIKVAMIGAGSHSFCKRLLKDILTVEEFQDTEFRLMDINEMNLEMSANICRKIINDNGLKARIVTTTKTKEAIKEADYVICMVRIGGLEAYARDIEIPLKYGVKQCIGDTLGPGGIFYGLRTIPFLLEVASDIREVAPKAILLNYSNPMAINTWALRKAGGIRALGLCHGVQYTHQDISKALGFPKEEVDYVCAGINHQTWFIRLSHNGRDITSKLLEALENDLEMAKREPCRIDVLRRFGYFSTESNGHLSEYLPWYRKKENELNTWISEYLPSGGKTGGYLEWVHNRIGTYKNEYPELMSRQPEYIKKEERTMEHASYIIEALETGRSYRGNINVVNTGLITNLPNGCIVEIPCYIDRTGVNPLYIGNLPTACAAVCRASVSVQELAVKAALTGDREMVKQAVLMDPLTAAVCTTKEVWKMCDEMFEELAEWLPQFNGEGATWKDLPLPEDGLIRKLV